MSMHLLHYTTLACAEQIRSQGFRNGTRDGDRPFVFFWLVDENTRKNPGRNLQIPGRDVLIEVQLMVDEPGPGWYRFAQVSGGRTNVVICIPDKIVNALIKSIRIHDGSDEPEWAPPAWSHCEQTETAMLDAASTLGESAPHRQTRQLPERDAEAGPEDEPPWLGVDS
jgi:hypothetical protein